jgi:oligopeptide/dipeptide ABC transporter ATP-binding protein
MSLLEIHDLFTRFTVGGRLLRAVDGVSITVEPGEAVGLVGESGCGKSTLARTVLGLERAHAGSVKLQGTELVGLRGPAWLPHRRQMQMIFQDPFSALNPRLSVGRIIEEPLIVHGLGSPAERQQAVKSLMQRVGLRPEWAGRFPHEFSGGQRQRVGIARALALSPKLVICDEPVSALDVSVQAQVVNVLARLQNELGLATLFISHDLAVVAHLCSRIYVMYLGVIVEAGDRHTLRGRPRHPYTRALVAASPVPDPERLAPETLAQGDIPSQLDIPTGCRFHPRCPWAEARCQAEVPALRPIAGGGEAACHFAESIPSLEIVA